MAFRSMLWTMLRSKLMVLHSSSRHVLALRNGITPATTGAMAMPVASPYSTPGRRRGTVHTDLLLDDARYDHKASGRCAGSLLTLHASFSRRCIYRLAAVHLMLCGARWTRRFQTPAALACSTPPATAFLRSCHSASTTGTTQQRFFRADAPQGAGETASRHPPVDTEATIRSL
jgi:hypothetical protein